MPVLSKTLTIDPNAVYVSWDTFAWENLVIQRGQELRGNAPVVQALPEKFVAADVPESEWPSMWTAVVEATERQEQDRQERDRKAFEDAAKRNPIKLDVRIVTCKTEHAAYVGGMPALVAKGSRALAADPVALQHAENWS